MALVCLLACSNQSTSGDGGTDASVDAIEDATADVREAVLTSAVVYTGPAGSTGATGTTFQDALAIEDGGAYERVGSIVDEAGLKVLDFGLMFEYTKQ